MNSAAFQIDWPTREMREEYQDWRKNTPTFIRALFTPQQLVIFYLHYGLGWGWSKVREYTKFTERNYYKTIRLFREYAYHASISYEQEISSKQLSREEI